MTTTTLPARQGVEVPEEGVVVLERSSEGIAILRLGPPSERDITRAPSCGWNRSRTIERPQVTAAPIVAPCSARHTISDSMFCAIAPSTLATVYSAIPTSRTGRRPYRSA